MVPVRFQRLEPEAVMPRQQSAGAAGLDLAALEVTIIPSGEWRTIRTGLAMELPRGYEGQVRPRSGLAFRHGVTVLNAPGTIDEDYRGEVKVVLINHGPRPFELGRGDRIAQLVVAPVASVDMVEVQELSVTVRNTAGFGSTGTSASKT